MPFSDLLGTISAYFQIGIKGSGERILRFKNDFTSDLKWNPTASRILQLPDSSGSLSLQPWTGSYDSGGSFSVPASTWTLYKQLYLNLGSAGGGGASGRCAPTGDRFGGGSGSAGVWADFTFPIDGLLQQYGYYPLSITVGVGGSGGASVSGTADGIAGSTGGFSSVAINGMILLYCLGGSGGSGGTTTAGAGGTAPSYGVNIGSQGAASSITASAASPSTSNIAATGGGAGGGVSAAGNGFSGGNGSAGARGITGTNTATARGNSSGGIGTDGAAASGTSPIDRSFPIPGQGGGGGGAGATTTGGKGGAGFRGGGGGGGGAGTTASGAGGKGGDGWCLVVLS